MSQFTILFLSLVFGQADNVRPYLEEIRGHLSPLEDESPLAGLEGMPHVDTVVSNTVMVPATAPLGESKIDLRPLAPRVQGDSKSILGEHKESEAESLREALRLRKEVSELRASAERNDRKVSLIGLVTIAILLITTWKMPHGPTRKVSTMFLVGFLVANIFWHLLAIL